MYIEEISRIHRGGEGRGGGCSVRPGDIMSTSGGYHEYLGGTHTQQRVMIK